MTLRQLIETAMNDLDRYRYPNVDEVQSRLHEILKAGDLGGISHDRLEHLSIRDGMLHIRTSYSVRSCLQSAEFEIPLTVIDAEDPLTTVKAWADAKRLQKAERDLARLRNSIVEAEKKVTQLGGNPNRSDPASPIIKSLLHQIYQMKGMFNDEDGTIAEAIDEAEEFLNVET